MLFARRKELHRLAAEAIEALFPGRLEELSATLGYHYERADAAERAIFYLGRAAERAKATFANAEAIAFYESAIGQITRARDGQFRESGPKLNEGLGDVLTLVGRHEEARDAFGRAQVLVGNADPISRSRLHRKIGFSHSLQRHFAETAREFDLADQELGEPGDAAAPDWWEEKVQVQLERMHLFYWQGMVNEMRELAGQCRTVIAEHGAAIQRAKFLNMMALSMLMESRFRPSQKCVELARRAVAASGEANNPSEAGHINFVLGLVQLCHGDFGDAVEQSGKALAMAEQTGDLVLQSRCLTYRAVAFRRLGDVARCTTEAKRTFELATKLGMVEYIAMAKATLAWIAWRQEDHPEAEELASKALELWHGMDDPYGFDWMALCPLIAIALYRQNSGAAMGFARGLLAENQHPLPEKLLNAIRKACDEWQIGAQENATADLASAMNVARELSYL